MRHALGLPLLDATFETWARHFCFELEPVFMDATLAAKLEPHALVMTRAEFEYWLRSQPLEYKDAYQPWSVSADFVALLTPAEFVLLEPNLRLELNAAQVRYKRGLTFPLELARGFGVQAQFLERDATEDSFLLRRDAWDALPNSAQFDWLAWYVSQDAPSDASSSLINHPALTWIGWLPHSGANCFATALSYSQPNLARAQSIAQLWLPSETLTRELGARGFVEQPFEHLLEPGWILAWRNSSGALAHACIGITHNLVLNKDSQAWYSPRQILELDTILERWSDVAPLPTVFAPISR